ncbi:MAG: CPBP family intramembrane metalloprotease [marine benthic group bacterium]|nr:CPBP family intramembrane metalloprotease [Gemmatimonadota bacterium]
MNSAARDDRPNLAIRVGAAWLLTLVALALAGWVGELVQENFGAGRYVRYGLQALIMSGLVVPGILWLRVHLDQAPISGLGLPGPEKSLRSMAVGIGLIAVPLTTTIIFAMLFGWANVSVTDAEGAWAGLLFSMVTVFFFEALPEELAFRGYIYRNLNTRLSRWLAGAVTVALFVLLPTVLVPIQEHFLGMDVVVGGASGLTAGYLITMAVFGSFVQYLRILTGTIWTGVGFHFAFVLLNRVIGPRSTDLIRFSDIVAPGPMQITAIVTVGLLAIGLLAYPKLSGRPIGWRQVVPE